MTMTVPHASRTEPYLLPHDDAGFAPCLGPVSNLDLAPVLTSLLHHHPGIDQSDLERVVSAFDIADIAHATQKRSSGDPYMIHPLSVAAKVADLGMDADTVAAALCHDVAEDTPITVDALAAVIGEPAARLVDGVTKLDAVADASKSARVAGSLRKLLVAATDDVRVLVVKLADRLHNMETIDALPPAKQERIAAETLEVYAPLAHRLSMSEVKARLEDLSFRVLEPGKFNEISELMDARAPESDRRLRHAVDVISQALTAAGVTASVVGRQKHVYSVYRKMVARQVQFDEIADLIGLRVVVNTPADCYASLGVLHSCFTPMPTRFRDYIALPKLGHYRSLHTTLIDADGVVFEVQLRTWEMHAQAEFGVAAHWKYKANTVGGVSTSQPVTAVTDLPWLSGLLTAGAAEIDPEQFLEEIRRDLGVGEVVALTPRGDVISLPAASTVLDFAYHVHTEIGDRAVAARINGRLSGLSSELHPGDRVEIVTSDSAVPHSEWLTIARTARARHAIRVTLNARRREDAVAAGREAVNSAILELGLPNTWEQAADPAELAGQFGQPDLTGLLLAVAEGQLAAETVSHAVGAQLAGREIGGVRGEDDVLLERAPCATGVRKEDTIGVLIAPGHVMLHSDQCTTAAQQVAGNLGPVDLDWPTRAGASGLSVAVDAIDRSGLLAEVCGVLAVSGADLLEVHAVASADQVARVRIRLLTADESHTRQVVTQLRSLPGVFLADVTG